MTVLDLSTYNSKSPTCVTIGVFDGVHIGHKKIIDKLCEIASKTGTVSTLLTFSDHPRIVLEQNKALKLLNTVDEKISILHQSPLDQVVVVPFTRAFAALEAEAFIKTILVDVLCVNTIVVGYDHRFGKNRTSSFSDLITYGQSYNFHVEELPAEELNNVAVSSTKIRTALEQGDITLANHYLGYHFMLSGIVVVGRKIGRTLGFPTANIDVDPIKIIPKDGVYVASCRIDGKPVFGMMNIGENPTLKGTKRTVEVHFFNFSDNLYGREVCVEIRARLRDEVAFSSLEELKKQLYKDQNTALGYIESLKP